MKKNIVWLASYPKSGNTWCRIFLASLLKDANDQIDINHLGVGNIFSSRSIIEEQTGYDISEFTADECDELRNYAFEKLSQSTKDDLFIKTHDAYLPLKSGANMFPLQVVKGAIYFVRNPFDVAVSFSNHLSKATDEVVERMCDKTFVLAAGNKKFNPQVRQKLLTWSEHILSWKLQNDFPILFIRYEDLLENPEREFRKILNFIGIHYEENRFYKALSYSNFRNLQQLEQKSGFKEKPVGCKQFFNKGESGYYRDYLSTKAIDKIIKEHSKILLTFNYINESGKILI